MTNNSSNGNNPKSSISPWIFAVGAILLLVIGFLTYSNVGKSSEIDNKVAALQETENLRMELETEFNQAIADLEDMRTSNEELNTLIEDQKTELEEQRTKISGLISSKNKLKSVRTELDKMKTLAAEYVAQVESLQAENQTLTETNTQLGIEKTELTNNLQTQVMENTQLNEAKAMLTSEKTALSATNEKLNATVNLASVVKVQSFQIDGFKSKGNGKKAKKKSADAIDDLQVCFQTTANDVTKAGEITYYIRVITPTGETLANQDKGSGVTKNLKTGEEIPFTKSVVKGYNNQPSQMCMNWQPSKELASGQYQVEVYNKGHLAGKSSFELK
jgi:predicted nuclease with TOPRIM domain